MSLENIIEGRKEFQTSRRTFEYVHKSAGMYIYNVYKSIWCMKRNDYNRSIKKSNEMWWKFIGIQSSSKEQLTCKCHLHVT